MLISIQSLYDDIKMTDNTQSSGKGHQTSKFIVISNSKGSSTRLLSKVNRQMKLRVTKRLDARAFLESKFPCFPARDKPYQIYQIFLKSFNTKSLKKKGELFLHTSGRLQRPSLHLRSR